jgi:hypothetical protein
MTLGRSKYPTTKLERISTSMFGADDGTKQIISWLNRNIPKIESWLQVLEEMKTQTDKQSGPDGSTSAMLYVHDASGSITVNETPVKITSFASVVGDSDWITPSASDDKITINEPGMYFIFLQCSFSGTASTQYDMHVYLNGAHTNQLHSHRAIGAGNDVGSASCGGLVALSAGDYLELYVGASADSKDFTLKHGQLVVSKIGL